MLDNDRIDETINVSFDEHTSYRDVHKGAVLGNIPGDYQWAPATGSDIEKEDIVEEVRATIDSSDSLGSPSDAESAGQDCHTSSDSPNTPHTTLQVTHWRRKVVPRKTGFTVETTFIILI